MRRALSILLLFALSAVLTSVNCGGGGSAGLASDAAERTYVAPGEKDEIYLFTSGGYNGQVGVHGIPSGRYLRTIPVFSVHPENGYGYSEETKNLLMTSHGFVPWDDSHHPQLSVTNGRQDGRWLFINGNNTPRIARIDLKKFHTEEIIEIPNSAGNHASPFLTENSEYAMAATRFSVPIPQAPVGVDTYAQNFKGTITMVKIDPQTGRLSIELQMIVPGFDYDLARCGHDRSHDWCFFSMYNSEQANNTLEINASRGDKDFIMAFNWVRAKQCADEGKAVPFGGTYRHNYRPGDNMEAVSEVMNGVRLLDPANCPGVAYYLPTPKSPHGADVDPTGEYIVGGGKLATVIPVHSFSKLVEAVKNPANVIRTIAGIPVLKYESTLAGEVQRPCLGPLHTEFDGHGNAYTSCFVSSEVVKWHLGTWEVLQHLPAYYSIGHLSVVGGDTREPFGKYLVALNKITKDRYLPTGMELAQSAQLYDISGSNAELLLDFPTVGEPHYAQMIPASLLVEKSAKIYQLEENHHPFATRRESEARIVRQGGAVHVYMTSIRSHFRPESVELRLGETAYFHVTNLEQDFDIPHGFSIFGSNQPNLLIMPGETLTVRYEAKEVGVFPFYCTDFCSALHQEMQHYIRVSP